MIMRVQNDLLSNVPKNDTRYMVTVPEKKIKLFGCNYWTSLQAAIILRAKHQCNVMVYEYEELPIALLVELVWE